MKQNKFLLDAPISVGVLTTNNCNLKCKHCMNEANDKHLGELSFSQIISIVDECCENNVAFIEFNGGEFFTRNDYEEILDYTVKKNIKIGITTNGTLFTDRWIKKYKNKIYLIRISLDSHIEKIHDEFRGKEGAFKTTVNNIKKLLNNDYKVTILHTISRSNEKVFEDFISFIDGLEVGGLHTTLLIPAGRGDDLIKDVLTPIEHKEFLLNYQRVKKNLPKDSKLKILEESPQAFLLDDRIINEDVNVKCGAAFTEVVVTNEGYVLPCAAFISVADKYKIPELSINNHSIISIYKNANLMKAVRDVYAITGECSKCDFLEKCGGGCRATADIMRGDIRATDPMCWQELSET